MKKSNITRLLILESAFDIIYKKGFQATSINDILLKSKLTKGAFYYHFETKEEMGLAVINEIIRPYTRKIFLEISSKYDNSLECIYILIEKSLLEIPILKVNKGCPIGNLIVEMTPWNYEFKNLIIELVDELNIQIINCINRGIKSEQIKSNIKPEQVSFFLISSYWGIRSLSKLYNDQDYYYTFLKEVKLYLNNLIFQ